MPLRSPGLSGLEKGIVATLDEEAAGARLPDCVRQFLRSACADAPFHLAAHSRSSIPAQGSACHVPQLESIALPLREEDSSASSLNNSVWAINASAQMKPKDTILLSLGTTEALGQLIKVL